LTINEKICMVTFKNIKKSISPSNHHEKFTIETAKPKKKQR